MSAPRWAFMKPYPIRDLDPPHDLYLWRLRIVQTPWFALYLHKICRPDNDRHLHDHPFAFAALVLKGGYVEEYASMPGLLPGTYQGRFKWGDVTDVRTHRPGRLNRMNKRSAHRITKLLNGPAWTLVFVGRRDKDWGFWTEDGWIQSDDYFRLRAEET